MKGIELVVATSGWKETLNFCCIPYQGERENNSERNLEQKNLFTLQTYGVSGK